MDCSLLHNKWWEEMTHSKTNVWVQQNYNCEMENVKWSQLLIATNEKKIKLRIKNEEELFYQTKDYDILF